MEKKGTIKQRLERLEQGVWPFLIELSALELLIRLLLSWDFDRADELGVTPLTLLVVDDLEEIASDNSVVSGDNEEWMRGVVARAALEIALRDIEMSMDGSGAADGEPEPH